MGLCSKDFSKRTASDCIYQTRNRYQETQFLMFRRWLYGYAQCMYAAYVLYVLHEHIICIICIICALYVCIIYVYMYYLCIIGMYADAKRNTKKRKRCALMHWSFFLLNDHSKCLLIDLSFYFFCFIFLWGG